MEGTGLGPASLDWWWRGRALARARAWCEAGGVPAEVLHVQRAQAALELGDRALDPIDPLRAGPSLSLALSLYRQAAYWCLCAGGHAAESGPGAGLARMFEAVPSQWLLDAAGSE